MKHVVNLCARVLVWVLIIAMPIVSIIFACGYNINIVHGDSMYPTLHNQDVVITEKNFTLTRNDIIVLDKENGQHIIKRVIALPGETVQIIDGRVYIDGVLHNDVVDISIEDAGLFAEPQLVPDNHYFVLGDNRNHSIDSRALGSISIDEILGRVIKHFGKGELNI